MGVHIECYSCLVLANDNWMDVRALLPLVPDAFLLRDFLLASMEPRHQPCPVRRDFPRHRTGSRCNEKDFPNWEKKT